MTTIADFANNWWNGLDIISQMKWVRCWKVNSKPNSEQMQMSFNDIKNDQKSISLLYLKARENNSISELALKVA